MGEFDNLLAQYNVKDAINGSKSLLPYFVANYVKRYGTEGRPVTPADVTKYIEEHHLCTTVDVKTVGRVLKTLCTEVDCFHTKPHLGYWYDAENPERADGTNDNGNARKSLAPYFIALILGEKTAPDLPMTQKELQDVLAAEPYGILIERKALSRNVRTLCESVMDFHEDRARGVWADSGKGNR